MHLIRAATTLTVLTLVGAPVGAQEPVAVAMGGATLAGVVYDSLHGRPLAGARVQLVPTGSSPGAIRAVDADSLGLFRFDGLEPARYVIGFMHPAVDALGLGEPVWSVALRGDSVHYVMLALPSAAGIRARFCALPTADDSTGMLLGIVRDPDTGVPLADASVTVLWDELTLDRRGLRHEQQRFPGKSNADGRYLFCSLPSRVTLAAHAELGDRASGFVEVWIPPRGLVQRDFAIPSDSASVAVALDTTAGPDLVPLRRGTSRITGRAFGPNGEPIAGARVTVLGSVGRGTTGPDGTFTLAALPAGTQMLDARALGYEPQRVAVDLVSGQTATVEVRFTTRIQELESIVVYGKPSRSVLDLAGFNERRSRGTGRYFTAEDIGKRQPPHVSALLESLPEMRVERRSTSTNVWMRGPGGLCTPTIYVDRVRLSVPGELDATVRPHEITGIEVYTMAQAPAEFMRQEGRVACGVVLIWVGMGPRNARK